MHPLGIVLSTVVDAGVSSFVELGQLAEAHGFAAALVNEGRGDALACSQAIAAGTERIRVGTNIANIYFRHPYLAAHTASTIADLSEGRLILGLGVSHRPLLASLGIEMGDPRETLRSYADTVRRVLAGEKISNLFEGKASAYPVPVLLASLTVESAAVAGATADGLMPFLPTRDYISVLREAAAQGARDAGHGDRELDCIVSIPTFLSDDEDAARSAARYNLAFFAQLPFYRRQWRRCGFPDAVDALAEAWKQRDRKAAAACVPNALIEQVCVFGSAERCRDQLAAFHEAGAAMPVLAVSPVNEDRLGATRKAIEALAPR
jgi:alkanesulfonate monooxygenase SsuD/methylene tetrahydromethanopterin reductase-like flavin-dependent oxidoreductase (luciferase family)